MSDFYEWLTTAPKGDGCPWLQRKLNTAYVAYSCLALQLSSAREFNRQEDSQT